MGHAGSLFFDIWLFIFIPVSVVLVFLEGRKRTLNPLAAFGLFVLLSPVLGFLVVSMFPLKNRRGCNWCGNKYNEAEYCGLCGKNEAGEESPWFRGKKK